MQQKLSESNRPTVSELHRGNHVCLTFEAAAKRDIIVAAFIRDGLARSERVVYVAADHNLARVRAALIWQGVGADEYIAANQLALTVATDVYLSNGKFDADALIGEWIDIAATAKADGFTGIRVAGDMGWALNSFSNLEPLYEYEQRIQVEVFAKHPVTGLCEFNASEFGDDALPRIRCVHCDGDVKPDPVWSSPNASLERTFSPDGAVLTGEIDFSTSAGLEAALHSCAALGGDLALDMSGVHYLDVRSLRILVNVALQLQPSGSLVLSAVPAHIRRVLEILKWDTIPGVVLA